MQVGIPLANNKTYYGGATLRTINLARRSPFQIIPAPNHL
jgi:hypothetical protein